jgi:hypothetical protein
MMKKKLMFALILSLLAFRVSSEENSKQPEWIKKSPKDQNFFWGVSQAPIEKGDVGKALIVAGNRAREEIAKQIKVRIVGELIDTMVGSTKQKGDSITGQFDQIIKEKVETYTNQTLEGIQEEDRYIDSEKEKEVWVLCKLSKEEFKNKVADDLKQKHALISGYALKGAESFDRKDIGLSLGNFLDSYVLLRQMFGSIPMYLTIEGKNEEMHSYLSSAIKKIISSIEITPIDERIVVTKGGIGKKTGFSVYYVEKEQKIPAKGVPLKFSFGKGGGRLDEKGKTGNSGFVEIRVYSLAEGCREDLLRAQVDLAKTAENEVDKEILEMVAVPFSETRVIRQPIIAFSVKGNAPGVAEMVKNAVVSKGYDVANMDISYESLENKEKMNGIYNNGVDYIVFVEITAGAQYSSQFKMYSSTASGNVALYKTETGTRIFNEQTGGAKGFGTSSGGAISDAVGKIKGSVNSKIKQALDGI